MKKVLVVLLIAVLTAGFAFAGISGTAELDFGYNTDGKTFGFDAGNSTLNATFELGSDAKDVAGDGAVKASVSASVALKIQKAKGAAGKVAGTYQDTFNGTYGFGVYTSIDSFAVSGSNWTVAYNGSYTTIADFAKSVVDTYTGVSKDIFDNVSAKASKALTQSATYEKYLPGVVAEYAGYKLGFAFESTLEEDAEDVAFSVQAATPEIALADGLKVKLAAAASKSHDTEAVPAKAATFTTSTTLYTNTTTTDHVYEYTAATKAVAAAEADVNYGVSLHAAYAKDLVSASVATDLSINGEDFAWDIAGKVGYDFATVDVYYLSDATIQEYAKTAGVVAKKAAKTVFEDVLSFQAVAKLDKFVGMPLSVTLKAKNVLNDEKGQDLSAKVAVVYDAITASVNGGYKLSAEKTSVGFSVAYAADMFTASVGADMTFTDAKNTLIPAVSVTSTKLVSGATVGIKWEKNTDNSDNDTTNLLDLDKYDAGNIYAFVSVAF